MREFNIFGPVYPDIHYHVDRVAVKDDLRVRIAKGRYLTLNAARQTGKTTLFREVIASLEATGEYFGILLNFEALADFDKAYFYEELGYALAEWRESRQLDVPEPTTMRHHGDFVRWLRACTRSLKKKGILIIDEFDAVDTTIIEPLLSLFRGMYLDKGAPHTSSVHSMLLVGVKNLPSLATPHRAVLMPMLLYNQQRTDFLDPVTQELIMYGVLRVVEDEHQLQYARIGNPIYRKMLLQRFAPLSEPLPLNGGLIHRYLRDGLLDFDALLDHFKAFMQEHGVRLLKSKKTERPLEISGQYLLFSYLTAALNTIQGYVTVESVSGAGEIDIMAFHRDRRFYLVGVEV